MSNHAPVFERPTQAEYDFRGPIGERIAANQRHWLMVAPMANPAMLTMFRDRDRPDAFGAPSSVRLLWWSGEFAGKYLISAVQGWRLTHDPQLRETIRAVVADLITYQAPDGYLGPFELAQRITGRDPNGSALWDLWGQYHCMLGLFYWYKETGDVDALAACKRAADLICRTFLDLVGKTWQFCRADGSVIAERIQLLADGRIAGYSHPNEASWGLEGDTVVFFAQDGRLSTRFTWSHIENGKRTLRGTFNFNSRITHVLNELDMDVPNKVWQFCRSDGTMLAERIHLRLGGGIAGYAHPNEASWGLEGDTLVFYAQDGRPSTRFTAVGTDHGLMVYRGAFLFDTGITHVLREVYRDAPAMNHACGHIFAVLYQETLEPRYLQMAREIERTWEEAGGRYVLGFQNGEQFFQSRQPRWESLHDVQAVAELYFITGDEKYRRAFTQIWSSIVANDRHNTGGFTSSEEATGNPYDPRPIETCGTIAWMALTLDMLHLTGDARAADGAHPKIATNY